MAKYIYAWFRGMSMSWPKYVKPSDVLNDLYGIVSEYDLPYIEMVFKNAEELSDTDLDVGDYVLLIITDWNPFGAKIVSLYFDGYRVVKYDDRVYIIKRHSFREKYRGIYVVYQKEKIFYDTLDPLYVLSDVKRRFGKKHALTIRVAYLKTNEGILYNKRGYNKVIIVTPIRSLISGDMITQVFGQEYEIMRLTKNRGYFLTRKEHIGLPGAKLVAAEPSLQG